MKKEKHVPKEKGECYYDNGRKFLELAKKSKNELLSFVLVHGIAKNQIDGKDMGHCWIEVTFTMGDISQTTCLDFSLGHGHSLTKETYYFIGGIKPERCKYYNLKEVGEMMLKHDHWGHWELDKLGLPEDR